MREGTGSAVFVTVAVVLAGAVVVAGYQDGCLINGIELSLSIVDAVMDNGWCVCVRVCL
jgi:hypothetical protein